MATRRRETPSTPWTARVVGSSPSTDRSGWLIAKPVRPTITRNLRPADSHWAAASGRLTAQSSHPRERSTARAQAVCRASAAAGSFCGWNSASRRQLAVMSDGGAPDALGQPGEVGRPERGRLLDDRPRHGHLQIVGLELQQQVVGRGAAVGLEGADRVTGRRAHGRDDVPGLEADRLEHRSGEVAAAGASGDADDRAARVRVPPGAAQPGEGGDDVAALRVRDRGRQRCDLTRRAR